MQSSFKGRGQTGTEVRGGGDGGDGDGGFGDGDGDGDGDGGLLPGADKHRFVSSANLTGPATAVGGNTHCSHGIASLYTAPPVKK